MTFKEVIKSINHDDDFSRACVKLEVINDIFGTDYFMLNRRVTFRCGDCIHDLYAYL